MFKKTRAILLMMILSGFSALNYQIFVFPNTFVPSGIDGICTMLQYLLGTNIGFLSLICNIPMLIAAFFIVDRDFVIKTSVYILSFSLFSLFFGSVDMSRFIYHTETGSSIVLAPMIAGVIRGVLYVFTLKENGSSGGVDIIAAIVHKYKPHYSIIGVITVLNFAVAISAYFVYDFRIEPVICSMIYSFVTRQTTKNIEGNIKKKIRFEIITSNARELLGEITEKLGLSATLVEAHGAYSGTEKLMVLCVTESEKVASLEKIIKRYPDAVSFESTVSNSINLRKR